MARNRMLWRRNKARLVDPFRIRDDAKIWLEPEVEVARPGRTLKGHELNWALRVIRQNLDYLVEEWYGYKGRAS